MSLDKINIFDNKEAFKTAFIDCYDDEKLRKEVGIRITKDPFSGRSGEIFASAYKPHPLERSERKLEFRIGCADRSDHVESIIETIRTFIFTAMQSHENSVLIPYEKNRDGYLYFCNLNKLKNDILRDDVWQMEQLDQSMFEKIVEPGLIKMLDSCGCVWSKSEELIQKTFDVTPWYNGRKDRTEITESRKLSTFKISWDKEFIPNYPLPVPEKVLLQKKAAQLFEQAFANQDMCDIEIVANDGSIRAHQLVLSLSSHVFRAMFENNMSEKLNKKIPYKAHSITTVKAVLNYIYSGSNPFEIKETEKVNPVELLSLSHSLEIHELADLAANEIGKTAEQRDYKVIGKLGVMFDNPYLLKVYNCYRLRKQQPINDEIQKAFEKLKLKV